jgi:hypothetical protein
MQSAGAAMETVVDQTDGTKDRLALALVLDQVAHLLGEHGDGEAAIAAARRSLAVCEPLDPSRGEVDRIETATETVKTVAPVSIGGLYSALAPIEIPGAIAVGIIEQVAESRISLARMLAEHGEPGKGGEIRHLGSSAVAVRRELVRLGRVETDADLVRVTERHEESLRHLAEAAVELVSRFSDADRAPVDRELLATYCADGGDKGIAALRALASRDPAFAPDLQRARALVVEQRRYAERAREIEQAEYQRWVKRADQLMNRGQAASAAKRHEEAVRCWTEAAELYRKIAATAPWHHRLAALSQFNLALSLERTGDRRGAARAMREAAMLFRRIDARDDHRFGPEARLARRHLRRLRRVRLFLSPRRR